MKKCKITSAGNEEYNEVKNNVMSSVGVRVQRSSKASCYRHIQILRNEPLKKLKNKTGGKNPIYSV